MQTGQSILCLLWKGSVADPARHSPDPGPTVGEKPNPATRQKDPAPFSLKTFI